MATAVSHISPRLGHGDRPRIAIVAPSLDILGGQGVQADLLAAGLARTGFDVTFLPINPPFPPPLRAVRGWPYLRTLLNESLFFPSLARLRHADVVHVFSASYWSFLLAAAPALVAARSFGKRAILNYHSGEAEDHLARWGSLVHPWLRLATELVVPSVFLRDVFARFGHPARVIPNVVDSSRFRFRERDPLRPRLLSVRNLEAHYRVGDVLWSFAELRRTRPDALLTVVGYGSEEHALRRLAAELGLDDVRFAGRVEPGDMPGYYDEADVLLNASAVDNQPLSILEAFAAGLPVVTTGVGDIPSLVRHEHTGLVVNVSDPRGMAAAVERLLADPSWARRLARRAREVVRDRTFERVVRLWIDAYVGAPC